MRGRNDAPRPSGRRIVTGVFGVFFILVAIGIVVSVDGSMRVGAVIAALVVGVLGVDACISAVRDRRSLLERIGPLP